MIGFVIFEGHLISSVSSSECADFCRVKCSFINLEAVTFDFKTIEKLVLQGVAEKFDKEKKTLIMNRKLPWFSSLQVEILDNNNFIF